MPGNDRSSAAVEVSTLRRRADFLKAARARRCTTPTLRLQGRHRTECESPAGIRFGLTCSRKIGNAVTRNRAKRRLRAVARELLPCCGRVGWDYVLVGRVGSTVESPIANLRDDFRTALGTIHRKPG